MQDVFESVIEVTEYFDGPRQGIALLHGRPYAFSSRFLDATEYSGDFESVDIFELVPVGAPAGAMPVLANAQFRVASPQAAQPPSGVRHLEVCWHVFAQASA
jgi:hypothetical protein